MDKICQNCARYDREYYLENGRMKRYPDGLCNRLEIRRRKKPEHSCRYFKPREAQREEELLIRRQEICAELTELTAYLEKIKGLAKIVKQIQEIVGEKR